MLRRYLSSLGEYFRALHRDLESASLGNLKHAGKELADIGIGFLHALLHIFLAVIAFVALLMAVVAAPVMAPLMSKKELKSGS